MSITLTGPGLTVETVVQVARENAPVALDPEARKRIEKCRALLEDKIAKKRSCTASTPASASWPTSS